MNAMGRVKISGENEVAFYQPKITFPYTRDLFAVKELVITSPFIINANHLQATTIQSYRSLYTIIIPVQLPTQL